MNFHQKIVLIYAHLSLKCHELNLRAFLIQKLGFFPSLCLSNARIFVEKVPVFSQIWARLEELGTLHMIILESSQ